MKSSVQLFYEEQRKIAVESSAKAIGEWLLSSGYYPEQNILPPCFKVEKFNLKNKPYLNIKKPIKSKIISTSYPKDRIHSRNFSIQSPKHYHDLVLLISENWSQITNHIFNRDNKIVSYSFPIPIDSFSSWVGTPLRTGRLIYQWITMAEKDLVEDSHKYKYLVKTDITNFYKSVYTHSISWALHDRNKALKDQQKCSLLGNKIDRLMQYANDQKTNGIPVGSALSDLIAEIILSKIDTLVSMKIKGIDFIATRFKDDYRFLCKNEDDANTILKHLSSELDKYNLLISKEKTIVSELPEGLYRNHNRKYQQTSIKNKTIVNFKEFEEKLLDTIDIHREYPGTGVIEKFLGELIDEKYCLKVNLKQNNKLIHRFISLLIFLIKESPKSLCHVLSIFELIYKSNLDNNNVKQKIREIIKEMIENAISSSSVFEFTWLVFFSKYLGLNIKYKLNKEESFINNDFVQSIHNSEQEFFKEKTVANLFVNPKKSLGTNLAEALDVFNRDCDESSD